MIIILLLWYVMYIQRLIFFIFLKKFSLLSPNFISVGGILADSLAVQTDALHMLTDLASFAISLFAIMLGRKKPSKYFTFGWKRAGMFH